MTTTLRQPQIPQALRQHVLAVIESTVREIGIGALADDLGVARTTVSGWLSRSEEQAWDIGLLWRLCQLERQRLHGDSLAVALRDLFATDEEGAMPTRVQDDARDLLQTLGGVVGEIAALPGYVRPDPSIGRQLIARLAAQRTRLEAAFDRLIRDIEAAAGIVPAWRRVGAAACIGILVAGIALHVQGIARMRRGGRRRDEISCILGEVPA